MGDISTYSMVTGKSTLLQQLRVFVMIRRQTPWTRTKTAAVHEKAKHRPPRPGPPDAYELSAPDKRSDILWSEVALDARRL